MPAFSNLEIAKVDWSKTPYAGAREDKPHNLPAEKEESQYSCIHMLMQTEWQVGHGSYTLLMERLLTGFANYSPSSILLCTGPNQRLQELL